MLACNTTTAYSLLTVGKHRKLQMEWSSLESIHQLLQVSTKSVSISVKTIVLAHNFKKAPVKVLMIDLTAPW